MTQLTLGEIVTWKPPKKVSFEDLKAALVAAGLDVKMARDMLPRNAFSRAARQLEKNRVIDRVKEDDEYLWFQFTKVEIDESVGNAAYNYETTLKLKKATGEVECYEYELQQQAQKLLDAELSQRNSADITRMVQRIFDDNKGDLVPIREQGGAYFVPDTHRGIADGVNTFLTEIGGSMRRYAVGDHPDSRESVAEDMFGHFDRLIVEFTGTCEDLDTDTKSDVQIRRYEKIAELRTKLECYGDLMTHYRDQIKHSIDEAEKNLTAKLSGRTVAPSPPPETVVVGTDDEDDDFEDDDEPAPMTADALLAMLA